MKELAALRNLRILSLFGTDVTDDGVKQLAALKNLTYLDLAGTQVSDTSLMELSAIPGLAHLLVAGTKVSDVGEKAFKQRNPKCELSGPPWREAIKLGRNWDATSIGEGTGVARVKVFPPGCLQGVRPSRVSPGCLQGVRPSRKFIQGVSRVSDQVASRVSPGSQTKSQVYPGCQTRSQVYSRPGCQTIQGVRPSRKFILGSRGQHT